jgi:hypothetical protein
MRFLYGVPRTPDVTPPSRFVKIPTPIPLAGKPYRIIAPLKPDPDRILRSTLIGQVLLPIPALLFLKPLKAVAQPIATVAASALLTFTLPAAPQVTTVPKPLTAVVQSAEDALRPTRLFGSAPEPGLPNLLFQRPLAGIPQPDIVVRAPALVSVPVAERTPLFLRPLVGVDQPIPFVGPPSLITVRFADLIPPTRLFGVEQPPFVNPPSRLLQVPVAETPPSFPDLLFFRPLAGVLQPEPGLRSISLLVGGRLPFTAAPLDLLFQRPLQGRPVDLPQASAPAIIRVPFAEAVPTFLRPLRGLCIEPEPEFGSVVLFGLEPDRDVLFLRPLQGRPAHFPLVADPPRIIQVPFEVPLPPLDILFQRPLAGIVQRPVVVRPALLLQVPFAELPPQKPLIGILQAPFPVDPSRIIGVPFAVAEPPINIGFQRPLVGTIQPEVLVPSPRLLRVPFADLIPFRLIVAGLDQQPLITGLSRILRVTFPDVTTPAFDVLSQRPHQGVAQPDIVVSPSSLVQVPFAERIPLFLRPLVAIVQPDVVVPPSGIVRVPDAELVPFRLVLPGIVQAPFVTDPSRIIRVPFAVPFIPINVLFQRPLQGIPKAPFVVSAPLIIHVLFAERTPPPRAMRGIEQALIEVRLPTIIPKWPLASAARLPDVIIGSAPNLLARRTAVSLNPDRRAPSLNPRRTAPNV